MRRFTLGLFAAVLLSGQDAFGQRPALFDPSKPLASSRVDVTKYGVVRGFDFSAADKNSRILDQLVSQVVSEPGTKATTTNKTLYFPGAPFSSYYLRYPLVVDAEHVYLEGDGQDLTRISGISATPTVIFGLRRNPDGLKLTRANFVDGAAVLKPGPANLNGKSYGLATLGATTLVAPATSAAFGPLPGGWPSVRQLHIGLCFDFKPSTWNGPVCGISQMGQPKPWVIHRQGNGFMVYFACADGKRRACLVMTPMVAGVCKLDVQIDLASATVTGWVDGVQVPVTDQGLGADFLPASNLKFIANEYLAFRIGGEGVALEASDSLGGCTDKTGAYLKSGYPDLVVYGFVLHNGLRYKNAGVGRSAARIDGSTENDYSRYFAGKDILWCYWPGFDPADVVQFRTVPFSGEPGVAGQCMLWLHPQSAEINAGTIKNCGMKNMSVYSGGSRMTTVLWGHLLHGKFENLTVDNGATALGSMSLGANYPITIRDCHLGGHDGAIFLDTSIANIRDIEVNRPGRAPFRFAGSLVDMSNVFVEGNGASEWVVKIHAGNNGGQYRFVNVGADWEDGISPSQGVVYCEGHSWNGPTYRTTLILENLGSSLPKGAVGIDLKSMGPATPSGHMGATFIYKGLNVGGNGTSPIIRTDGPFWLVSGAQEGRSPWAVSTVGAGNFSITPNPTATPSTPDPAKPPAPRPATTPPGSDGDAARTRGGVK
jgi:hypothetical protein